MMFITIWRIRNAYFCRLAYVDTSEILVNAAEASRATLVTTSFRPCTLVAAFLTVLRRITWVQEHSDEFEETKY